MNENDENKKIDKWKVVSNALTASITILLVGIVAISLYIIISPKITEKSSKAAVENSKETQQYLDRIKEAMVKIQTEYVDDVDMEKVVEGAIDGMAEATGDPYTRYVSKEEYDKMLVEGKEEYDGIGVHITYDVKRNGILILGLMPNSPALEAGLKNNDVILQVDDMVVTIDNYKEAVEKLKGVAGTKVTLKVKRGEELITKEAMRKKIVTNNTESEVLENNIGYIKIWSFENGICDQFKAEYEALKAKNVSGLVIDLRNNPGGLVNETIDILSLLLPKGEVLKLVKKDGSTKVYNSEGTSVINIPLVVLVNSSSASASEILASAVKDSQKGILIGNKTYGKGIVQTIERLSFGDAISITTSKYYTASGIEIHKNGIEPNIKVDLPEDVKNETVIPKDKDTQLQKALEYIKKPL